MQSFAATTRPRPVLERIVTNARGPLADNGHFGTSYGAGLDLTVLPTEPFGARYRTNQASGGFSFL